MAKPHFLAASSAHVLGPGAPPDTTIVSAGSAATKRSTVSRSLRDREPTIATCLSLGSASSFCATPLMDKGGHLNLAAKLAHEGTTHLMWQRGDLGAELSDRLIAHTNSLRILDGQQMTLR